MSDKDDEIDDAMEDWEREMWRYVARRMVRSLSRQILGYDDHDEMLLAAHDIVEAAFMLKEAGDE